MSDKKRDVWPSAIRYHSEWSAQGKPQNLRLCNRNIHPRNLDTPRQGHKFQPGGRQFWNQVQELKGRVPRHCSTLRKIWVNPILDRWPILRNKTEVELYFHKIEHLNDRLCERSTSQISTLHPNQTTALTAPVDSGKVYVSIAPQLLHPTNNSS